MELVNIEKGDIVQIVNQDHAWFGCLLVVDEIKKWGVQAYCLIPTSNDGSEQPGSAYNRLDYFAIAKVGRAIVICQ